MLAGVERFEVVPDTMAASAFDFRYYPYGHSLLAALLIAVYFITLFGPSPTDIGSVAVSGLVFFALTFGLGFLADRHRRPKA